MATPIIHLNKRDFQVLLMAYGRALSTISIQPSANINLIFMRDDAKPESDNNDKFVPGDVCWLKSGGPAMTVTTYEIRVDAVTHVEWFDGNSLQGHAFLKQSLTHTKPFNKNEDSIYNKAIDDAIKLTENYDCSRNYLMALKQKLIRN